MGPALQRLLERPSSVGLLRYLVGASQEFRRPLSIRLRPTACRRHSSSASVAVQETSAITSGHSHSHDPKAPAPILEADEPVLQIQNISSGLANTRRRYSSLDYGPWKESSWTREDIDFESNVEEKGLKLVEQRSHSTDLRLWACLFDYRQRTYGIAGVRMFWNAVKRGDFRLPVVGAYAQLFWEEFVKLGLQDDKVLDEIVEYANQMLESKDARWSKLYIRIVQHMLLNGRGEDAIVWHNRLFDLHPPGPNGFAEMVHQIIFRKGDTEALKEIYEKNSHRNVYGKVIPFLCEQEDFESAYRWHFTFVRNGDLPITSKKAEPLVHFLAIYYRPRAIRVTRSLVEAGVPFASSISSTLAENAIISREMMNLMHGETFNIAPKPYNDDLGARWFATRFISLDIAMTAISALGIKEIGPMSLQAIALREQEAEGITQRINQLRDLDVSIGNSVFSRSVEKFARSQNQAFLDCLLQSDQHPDTLEDPKFLEQLLSSYERSEDWLRYRLTLAIRLIGSKDPEMETKNIMLRSHAKTGNTSALLASLRKMHLEGATVTTNTVKTVLQSVLRPRQHGRRPITPDIKQADDIKMAIDILKSTMQCGSFVSATYWREIIKRLGMLGRWKELEDLCIFLASWYGPANRDIYLDSTKQKRVHRYRVPAQVKTIHPLHPLKILFPTSLQRAIVEWGFMHALRAPITETESKGLIRRVRRSSPVTSGIQLLKRLREYHVHIDINTVRKAVFDRLVVYYGPGQSNKLRNRRAREHNVLQLEEMAIQIDEALGMRMFHRPDLRQMIETRGNIRLRKVERKVVGQLQTARERERVLSLPD